MKDQALEIARSADSELLSLNKLREYLQHVILRELFDRDALEELVFHGGTALRMIHGLERFSEDLDFHTLQPDKSWDLRSKLESLKSQIEYQGYKFHYSKPAPGPVKSSFLKFEGLLFEADLSDHENETVQIKLEVDTNPPAGFSVETRAINQYFPFVLHPHDKPTFLAGKLHAILQRSWTKGRDYYDLWFYCMRWKNVGPNIPYLRNALEQTDYTGPPVSTDNWKNLLAQEVKNVDWSGVKSDVEPFLLRQSDRKAFRKDLLLAELES